MLFSSILLSSLLTLPHIQVVCVPYFVMPQACSLTGCKKSMRASHKPCSDFLCLWLHCFLLFPTPTQWQGRDLCLPSLRDAAIRTYVRAPLDTQKQVHTGHTFAKSTHTLVNSFLLWSLTPKERTNLLLQRVQRCHTVFIWMCMDLCVEMCVWKQTQILVERVKLWHNYWSQHVLFISDCIFVFFLLTLFSFNYASVGNLCGVYDIASASGWCHC